MLGFILIFRGEILNFYRYWACLSLQNTSILPQILIDPVSLKLLAAGEICWALYSFCGENFKF